MIIDTTQPGNCRSCLRLIFWRTEKSGAKCPYDGPKACPSCHGQQTVVVGFSTAEGQQRALCETCGGEGRVQITHFASCPKAAEHRRRKKATSS